MDRRRDSIGAEIPLARLNYCSQIIKSQAILLQQRALTSRPTSTRELSCMSIERDNAELLHKWRVSLLHPQKLPIHEKVKCSSFSLFDPVFSTMTPSRPSVVEKLKTESGSTMTSSCLWLSGSQDLLDPVPELFRDRVKDLWQILPLGPHPLLNIGVQGPGLQRTLTRESFSVGFRRHKVLVRSRVGWNLSMVIDNLQKVVLPWHAICSARIHHGNLIRAQMGKLWSKDVGCFGHS